VVRALTQGGGVQVFAALLAIILGVEPFPPLGKVRGWLKVLGILLAAGGALVLALGKPAHGGGYTLDADWPKGMPAGASSLSAVGVDHLAPNGAEIYISSRGGGLTTNPILVFNEAGTLLRRWGDNT
jgi:hypothetical protein